MSAFAVEEGVGWVAIRVLGGFGVFRGGVAVPLREWQSRKARDLLKLLVARLGRPAPRESLLEALWPEQDPRRTRPRLSVALSTVRAVLDPGRRLDPGHYVSATREAVALETGRLALDLDAFLAQAEAALALARRGGPQDAVAALLVAEAAYAGDFLEEDLYEEWAVGPREQARAVYLSVVRALVESAAGRGDHEAVARHALQLLGRDPYDEPAHLALVAARTAAKAHGEARRAYHAYTARMGELDLTPAPFPAPGADPKTTLRPRQSRSG
jgi:DNA-binding SARP family transcriptional activator